MSNTVEANPHVRGGNLSEAKRKLLANLLKGKASGTRPDANPIVPRNHSAPVPLSLPQEQIWYRSMAAKLAAKDAPPFYNESITIHRYGSLDLVALERSLTEIVRRNEGWRTTFDLLEGEKPAQIIQAPPERFPILRHDLTAIPWAEKEKEAHRLATKLAREPFDLKAGPLVRVMVITLDENNHRLHVTMHQIVVDGVSVFHIFPVELAALYEAYSQGRPVASPDPAIQYPDFACWQRANLEGEILEQQLKYWEAQFSDLQGGLPAPHQFKDEPRPPSQTYRGCIQPGVWPPELTAHLHAVCRRESVTLFMALLAGFALWLREETGREDIIVGTLAPAGRERQEVQKLLGYFLNPVPLRFKITGAMNFLDVLRQAREVVSGAIANDDVPFHRIVERITGKQDANLNPFFDALISLAPSLPDLPVGWGQTFMDVESGGSTWNLYLELNERPNNMVLRAQYNPDVFENEMILRMMDELKTLLEAAAAEPQKPVSEFFSGPK